MPILRVMDKVARPMQRLGYLKHLVQKIASNPTNNMVNVGHDLVDIVLKKVKVQLNENRANYVKIRLFDKAYKKLKEQTDLWLNNVDEPSHVLMEIQDAYLSDSQLPSQVGKLVKDDWRKYPQFGINLGLIREGTNSITTRGLTILHFTSSAERNAFLEYDAEVNPFLLALNQKLVYLYSLIENDGEVFLPLLKKISQKIESEFSDRDAGDLIPDIYSAIISRYKTRSLSYDLRQRLDSLDQSSVNIVEAGKSERYLGGSSREIASRPRIEPYADIGLFIKPNSLRYVYSISPIGLSWAKATEDIDDSIAIEYFLNNCFFHTVTDAWRLKAELIDNVEDIVDRLKQAAKIISSSSGYSPIEELALLAGIDALVEDHQFFEIGTAREAIIAYQKTNPYQIRFTVDRMGTLAYAKFVEDSTR